MRKIIKIVVILLIVCAVLAGVRLVRQWRLSGAPLKPVEPPPAAVFNVGYQVYDFRYQKADTSLRNLTLALWYPTGDPVSQFDYQSGRQAIKASVAVNGQVDKTKGPYPLLVFAHGGGACGTQSVYIAHYLASQGYVVAAPDFDDSFLCSIKQDKNGSLLSFAKTVKEWGQALKGGQDPFTLWPNRLPDTKIAIGEMLSLNKNKDSIFYETIRENNIAVFGHSLGGWNTAVISGAVSTPYESYADERLKAALFYAPAVDPMNPADFAKIKIPVMYLFGEKDQDTNPLRDMANGLSRRVGYDNGRPPKYLGIIKQANHFVFADMACQDYTTVEDCRQSNGQAQEILKYSLVFFNRYLKNDLKAEEQLSVKDGWFLEYEYQK